MKRRYRTSESFCCCRSRLPACRSMKEIRYGSWPASLAGPDFSSFRIFGLPAVCMFMPFTGMSVNAPAFSCPPPLSLLQ
ncbi:hypothetical protein LHK_01915 [Laribacter hongkongensis HLHK9]|uniref:Uncharacterized protein n=1 Tax=Laribacter hongkongensis (strain HLHK9) TaxID=557598 RepID=C1D8V9_LARHH|nr:hypothetical protein LHK_01915 [Laribacter hongkongensis HLHK9]